MSVIDTDEFLQEIDSEEPCGPNLEYDPDFVELETAIVGKPEVQYGDTITPAVPPEWKLIKKLAQDLLGRSRDLRLAVPFSRSLMALSGMQGFADGLLLIKRLLEERWDSVHPQLDPDDGDDPMLRINSLASLMDLVTTIRELKETAIIVLPGLGPLSLRDLEIANGEVPAAEDQPKMSISSITSALLDVEEARLQAALDAATLAYECAVGIEDGLAAQVGRSQALNMSVLTKNLKRAKDFLAENMAQRNGGVVAGAESEQGSGDAAGGAVSSGGGGAVGGGRAAPISGEIASREDVSRMIDKICVYYEKYEPSSPVPLVLQRAKRLVTKNFMEIMEDLAPDGINQVTVISGAPAKSSDDDDY